MANDLGDHDKSVSRPDCAPHLADLVEPDEQLIVGRVLVPASAMKIRPTPAVRGARQARS